MTRPEHIDPIVAPAGEALCGYALRKLLIQRLHELPTFDQRLALLRFHTDDGRGTMTVPGSETGSHLWEIDLAGAHGTGETADDAVRSWQICATRLNAQMTTRAA